MGSRHLSRSIAVQTLYELDFHQDKAPSLDEILQRNVAEFGPDLKDVEFAKRLVENTLAHKGEADAIIVKAAPEWPLDKINLVDRNILRLGLYELIWGNHQEVPERVAIDEAIELAKEFGGESSGKFINGVLGTIYREMGGMDQTNQKHEEAKNQTEA